MNWGINNKRAIGILTILLFSVGLSGCWDYREINQLSLVTSVAIDLNNEGDYIVTVEILNPTAKGREVEMTPVVLGIEGETIFEAVRKLIIRTGKKLYWGHAKAIIISEEVAHQGIKPILDWVYRDAEVRADMWLLTTRGEKATAILTSRQEINASIGFQLDNTFKNQTNQPSFVGVELWNFLQTISAEGYSPVMPLINLVEYQGKPIPQIYGTAVFSKDQMIGELNGLETKAFNWMTQEGIAGLIVVEVERESQSAITYEVLKKASSFTCLEKNGEISMIINVKFDVAIAELNNYPVDYQKVDVLTMLEEQAKGYIEERVHKLVNKVLTEYKSDIFGFGNQIKKHHPNIWKEINGDWTEKLPGLPYEVNVEFNIKSSAMISTPILMRD